MKYLNKQGPLSLGLVLSAMMLGSLWLSPEWLAKINLLAAMVTAICTAVLGWYTFSLAKETAEMRLHATLIAKDASQPAIIIYADLEEYTRYANIILKNVTVNPAYDVVVKFDPDCDINQYKKRNPDIVKNLSSLFRHKFELMGPMQSISRTYGVHNDGTGAIGPLPMFETKAIITFRGKDGTMHEVIQDLSSNATIKEWFIDPTASSNRNYTIAEAGATISKSIELLREEVVSRLPLVGDQSQSS